MGTILYERVLIAKNSPQNSCFVADGEWLTVLPLFPPTDRDRKHYFVSLSDLRTRAALGWVQDVESFSLESFLGRASPGRVPSADEVGHVSTMLESIRNLPAGAPVAVSYILQVLPDKRALLRVHRVIVYDVRND